jgi:hypothetical protein
MADDGVLIRGGASVVLVKWFVTPFRDEEFAYAWAPAAEAALRYGARGYAFLRSKDDKWQFSQLAFFDDKLDWERYWYSEEIADIRAQASGLYQIPVEYEWLEIVSAGSLAPAQAEN